MPARPLRVVVADDQTPFRVAVRRLAARAGDLEVVGEAADGAEAVRLTGELHPDLALLDVRMPGLAGPEAAAVIARRWPSVAVLLCSSHAVDDLPADLPAPFVAKEMLTADVLRAAVRAGRGGVESTPEEVPMTAAAGPPPATRRWLEHVWSLVAPALPPPPARVLEVGCGSYGGLVPRLRAAGYDAVGVDPEAPDGPAYRRVGIEQADAGGPFAAVVASTSLHHVDELGRALEAVDAALAPGGVVVVVEWDRAAFDEPTAQWCFHRLPDRADDDGGWLRTHFERPDAERRPWPDHVHDWAAEEALHGGDAVLSALRDRFAERRSERGPYFFADLGIPPAEEQAAIDAGEIRANGLLWVGEKLNREQ